MDALQQVPAVREVEAKRGDAYANYRPGSPLPSNEVALVVAGQPVVCSRQGALDVLTVLVELFGPPSGEAA